MTIREVSASDAQALLPLFDELGYPTSATSLSRRLERLIDDPAYAAWAATDSGTGAALGFAAGHMVFPIEDDAPAAQLIALVTDPAASGKGVGTALVQHFEGWAQPSRCATGHQLRQRPHAGPSLLRTARLHRNRATAKQTPVNHPAPSTIRPCRMRWAEMRWRVALSGVYVSVVVSSSIELVSLERRPDLVDAFWQVQGTWPVFMEQDPVSKQNYVAAVEAFPNLHLIALRNGTPIARVHAVPITWPGPDDLPDSGWDWALGQALDHGADDVTAVSLIEIRIIPSMRGQGLSHVVLDGVREQLSGLGTRDLVGPVRPNGKAREPRTPISEYAFRQRADGLPFDDWLRVHARAGGRIVKPAPLSMTIPGSLTQWREWTGMAFDTPGSVDLDGALAPVHVDLANDHAVYVEPNVWVHHQLSPR